MGRIYILEVECEILQDIIHLLQQIIIEIIVLKIQIIITFTPDITYFNRLNNQCHKVSYIYFVTSYDPCFNRQSESNMNQQRSTRSNSNLLRK